jgi:hypothetical protein
MDRSVLRDNSLMISERGGGIRLRRCKVFEHNHFRDFPLVLGVGVGVGSVGTSVAVSSITVLARVPIALRSLVDR